MATDAATLTGARARASPTAISRSCGHSYEVPRSPAQTLAPPMYVRSSTRCTKGSPI